MSLCVLAVVAFSQVAGLCGGGSGSGSGSNNPFQDAVVFDIDGTVTEEEFDFFNARDHVHEVVDAWQALGYQVVFLTRRPSFMEELTREWMDHEGFGDVALYTAGLIPPLTDGDVIDFKRDMLLQIEQDENLNFEYGYGNMATDFTAYAQAGIPSAHVIALADPDGDCESGAWLACIDGYAGHVSWVEAQPPGQ
jgi:phosphatidate phosphatase PAH1